MINDEEQKPFPFDEIRDENGDYFSTVDQAKAAGFSERQIWSVTIDDELDEDTEGADNVVLRTTIIM